MKKAEPATAPPFFWFFTEVRGAEMKKERWIR